MRIPTNLPKFVLNETLSCGVTGCHVAFGSSQ